MNLIRCIFSIISVLISFVAGNAGANVPERNVTLLVGQSTRLNCSRNIDQPVEWFHESVGIGSPNLVCTNFIIVGYYRSRGRHTLAGGTNDLLISNATDIEAGKYACKDATDLNLVIDAYDVMVLKSLPHCTANRSLNDLLVDNDCNLPPDYVELNCSVAYRGNFPPVLRWRHSAQPDSLVSRSTSQHQGNSIATSRLQLTPDFRMNGTYFICYVENLVSESQTGTCSTPNLTIAYIYHPTTTINPDTNTVTCSANTSSQQCVYRWYGTHAPTNVSIESTSQTLQLDESLNDLRCDTKCQIRGDVCSVTSSVSPPTTMEKNISREGYSVVWIVVSVISTALVIGLVLLICYVIRKCKKRQHKLHDEAVDVRIPLNPRSILSLFSDTAFKDFDEKNMSMLLECLDAVNGLADILHSKGLLKEGDCYRLAKISSYEEQARDLLGMLKSRIKNESERIDFLKALEDTDQKHICNELNSIKDATFRILNDRELSCIQKNYPCLLDLINPQDSFIDLLIGNCCLTKQQGNRIKQQAGNTRERNRELIAIMRRRSFAHFLAFKSALKETQPKVFQILDRIETSVVMIHSVSSVETPVDDVAGIESNICESLNNTHQLSEDEQHDITSLLRPLTDNGVEFVGASPTGSIVVYFLCNTFDAVVFFKKYYDSGELRRILQSVFNIVARCAIHLNVEVDFEKTQYKQIISDARKTIYYNDIEKKTVYPDIMLLPGEMTQMILKKALILCWSAGLRNTRYMRTSKSKALFTKFMRDGEKSACINLKSVSYEWMGICELKSLSKQGCFPKQQLLDAGQTAKDKNECESNIRNQQTEESQTHNLKTSQDRFQEKSVIDVTAPKAFAIGSYTSKKMLTIDESNANMAELFNKIRNFKQNHNKVTTKCYQLKIHHMMDDDVKKVIRKFYELETQPALNKLKQVKDQWRTLDLWDIVQHVNPRPEKKFDPDEIIKQDEILEEHEADETLRRSIVLCCMFEDVMKELGWKVGDTLDIEEDICDVVGKMMMNVTEKERDSILHCMRNAIINIKAHGGESKFKGNKLGTLLLTTGKKYNGFNLACILLEQMILDNKDIKVSWLRIVCTQFIELVVQLIIEPDYREEVLSILNHLMTLKSLWSITDIYVLMRNGILMFQYRQDYFIRCLTMIKRFAVHPSMNICLSNHQASLNDKSIIYCRDESAFRPLKTQTYDVANEKTLSLVLMELNEVEIGREEQKMAIKLIRNSFEKSCAIMRNKDKYEHEIRQELQRIRNSEKKFDADMLSSCLAVTSMALYMSKGFWCSKPQLVSYCLLLDRNAKHKGRLLEISTGEGKSCVIAMVAASYALLGRTVDIVTSSPVLSQRDAEEWQTFYEILELDADCNVEDNREEDNQCYKCPIVYGTVETFARDILKTEFLLQDVRKGRTCDIVIVDEVDSMLIDQGVQCTYLSNDLASIGMCHFKPILTLIWMHVSRLITMPGEGGIAHHSMEPELFLATLSRLRDGIDPLQILRLAENAMRGGIKIGFTDDYLRAGIEKQEQLLRTLSASRMDEFFKFAVGYLKLDIAITDEFPIPQRTSILILGGGLSSVVFPDDVMRERLRGMIFDALLDEIVLPVNLRVYCISRLDNWINNAFVAKQMKYGREYIVENNEIYPVDYKSTGVIEINKKWGDGLQQFLEMKHGLPLSPLALVTNFLSNIDYFERYDSNILGVSGTLGTTWEREFMKKTFSVDLATIPTSKSRKLFELDGQILGEKKQWKDAVLDQVELAVKNERAVFIICNDIATATYVHELIVCLVSRMKKITIYMYTKNTSSDENQVHKLLKPRDVVITTNLGARGSDFVTDDIVNKNGGLFVLVTFIPMNDRVEKQAFGRTGRRGATGTCQIIAYRKTMPEWLRDCETVDEAKRLRDSIGLHRLHETDEVGKMRNKQALFLKYCELKKRFVTSSHCDSDDLNIQVELLDETWAKWLQYNEAKIHASNHVQMVRDMLGMLATCFKRARHFDSENIYNLMEFAAVRLSRSDFQGATNFYDQVICKDPAWSAFAHYNRAYCTLQSKDRVYIRPAINDLKATLRKLEIHKKKLLFSESFKIKNMSLESNVNENSTYERNNRLTEYYTMMECQLLHHIDTQINETIEKLEMIGTKNEEVKTVCRNILDVIPNGDSMIERILEEYRQLGLLFIFNINEESKLCYNVKIVSSLVLLKAVSDMMFMSAFQGISDYTESQFESKYVSDLLGTVNDDSISWISKCVKAAGTTGNHSIVFLRDISSLVPQSTHYTPTSTSKTNPKTSQLNQFSRNQARHVLTLLSTATQDMEKLICLTEDALFLYITHVVRCVLDKKITETFREKLKPGQKLHRDLCALYVSVTLQRRPDLEQFVDCIKDLAQALAHSSEISDTDFGTGDPTNMAVKFMLKSLHDSIISTDTSSVIPEIKVTAADFNITTAISKVCDLLADNIHTYIQKMQLPDVDYFNVNSQMIESTNKVLTSVCNDIICLEVQSLIIKEKFFDLNEKTMRSFSLIYEKLSNAIHELMEYVDFEITPESKYLKIVSGCSLRVKKKTNELCKRSMTENEARFLYIYLNCDMIILDVDKGVIVKYSSPEYHRTIQLVYNPPCCEFPGGHYDAYKDGKVVKVIGKKIKEGEDEEEEEDDNLLYSAIVTALNLPSFIYMKQFTKSRIQNCFRDPNIYLNNQLSGGEFLASEHYACQLKRGRAMLRLNMNRPTTQTDQSEHVQLDSSHLLSCIEQALISDTVSQLARVLAKSTLGRHIEVTGSQVSHDACQVFLFSGRSAQAEVYRQLVVERINNEDITTALQLCYIGHQIQFCWNIVDAISSTSDPQVLRDTFERMNKCALYGEETSKFLSICDEWYRVLEPRGLMDVKLRKLLRKWIVEREYANVRDSVVSLVIKTCSIPKKNENKTGKEESMQRR